MDTELTFLIIADDLTGAADTAARCRFAGWPAEIAVAPPRASLPRGVLAINTDTRHLAPVEAAARVRALCAPLAHAAATRTDVVWYKKIDSTLRGNLGAELDALMPICGAPVAVVCPAFPAQNRGLEGGYLVYAGAADARVHLPARLRHQSAQSVASISLPEVHLGVEALANRLRSQVDAGHTLLVVDAMEDSDLDVLLAACAASLPDALFCGSAGLIGALAGRAATSSTVVNQAISAPDAMERFARMLIVVGSGSRAAHAQIRALAAGDADAQIVVVGDHDAEASQNVSGDVPITLLHLPPPAPHVPLDGVAARVLAAQLGDAALDCVRNHAPDLLILVGGDTAIALLTRLQIDRLEVVRELLPGMPLTRAMLPDGKDLSVVLKAGNHGQDDTLRVLVAQLWDSPWVNPG